MAHPSPGFLVKRGLQLLAFAGKGGVGKTTCATACALQLALRSPNERFLIVSTDPAHSLSDSLGGMPPPENLTVLELDAQQCLEAFRAEHARPLQEIAAAGTFLDDEDIRRFLDLSLPGLDELMAFLEISGWVERGDYSCIVVDTAPSGHTLRLLEIPQLLSKWLGVLNALLAKRRYLRQVFARCRQRDQSDVYLANWRTKLYAMELLLRDPVRSQFVPVTIAEPMSITETVNLLHEMQQQRVPISELVVNQLHAPSPCQFCAAMRTWEWSQLQRLRSVPGAAHIALWGVDLLAEEVRGRDRLLTFWSHAWPIGDAPTLPSLPFPSRRAEVESPAPSFPSALELIIFSGKGGVGKTTLACATALRLAEDWPGKRVLLLSTDPAHSTSDCLGRNIGKVPAPILPNLYAVEMDAAVEFAALKRQYAQDIERALDAVASGFDLTFDRTVLEKVMDLAPPGLDELMAVTRITEFMAQGSYDLFVLDSALTGHLVRLLEMPDLIDRWLKAFFNLFLKYENVLRLPGFAGRLIELSKSLKAFRCLTTERRRLVLCAVSIPTIMALEETKDLLASCSRLRVAVPAIFLNLMTPPEDNCGLCRGLRSQQVPVAEAFAQMFPAQTISWVYRQGKVSGLQSLRTLGRALYQPEAAAVYA